MENYTPGAFVGRGVAPTHKIVALQGNLVGIQEIHEDKHSMYTPDLEPVIFYILSEFVKTFKVM